MGDSHEDMYALQWNNHVNLMKEAFEVFRSDNELVDVTLSCEGKKLKAHKIVLSACSVYFLDLFRDNPCKHPIVILRDIKYQNMVDILNFIYLGEVNVAIEYLDSFLKTAEYLQIKGLVDEKYFINPTSTSRVVTNTSLSNKNNEVAESTVVVDNKDDSQLSEPTNSMDTEMDVESSPEDHVNKSINAINSEYIKTEIKELDETSNSNSIEVVDPEQSEIKSDTSNCDSSFPIFETVNSSTNMSNLGADMLSNLSQRAGMNIPTLSNVNQHTGLDVETGSNRNFPCPHCDKVFIHANSLNQHLPKHSGETKCTICNSVLGRKYDLKMHMLRKHNIIIRGKIRKKIATQ